MKIEHFGEIFVDSEAFCVGCTERDLRIDESKLYAGSSVAEIAATLTCSHIDRCRRLNARLLEADRT